jgi:HSP20 family molecular chaperone IbpA
VPLPKTSSRLSTLIPSVPDGNNIHRGLSDQSTRMREDLDMCRKGAPSAPLSNAHRGGSVVEQLADPVFLGHLVSPPKINSPSRAEKGLSPIRSSSSASSILTSLRTNLSPSTGSVPPGGSGSPACEPEAAVAKKHPTVEVNTSPSAYTLSIHLPSFHRDEITVSLRKHRVLHIVADRFLTLSSVLHNSEDEHFEKRISFGYDADMRGVRADFSEGVLRVTVPRRGELVTRS